VRRRYDGDRGAVLPLVGLPDLLLGADQLISFFAGVCAARMEGKLSHSAGRSRRALRMVGLALIAVMRLVPVLILDSYQGAA